jgi:hypothetical protein
MTNDISAALATIETDIERVAVSAVAVLARSEVEAQLDAAHKYPRSIGKFLKEATTLATLSQEIAEACIYTLPRGGKPITGPSVRLAEIAASAYGNMHVGARVVGVEDKEVVSQGVAWDLEKNLRVTIESRRRITGKGGKRYDDDMITMTGNAAASIARRNAIFQVVPRAYINLIYSQVKEVAVGTVRTIAARREDVVARLGKMGVSIERVLARVEKAAVADIGLQELETLIGLGTALKNGDAKVDDAFPAVEKGTAELEAKLRAQVPEAKPTQAKPADTLPVSSDEKCFYCKEPAGPLALEFEGPDGEMLWKHPACTAFGKGV